MMELRGVQLADSVAGQVISVLNDGQHDFAHRKARGGLTAEDLVSGDRFLSYKGKSGRLDTTSPGVYRWTEAGSSTAVDVDLKDITLSPFPLVKAYDLSSLTMEPYAGYVRGSRNDDSWGPKGETNYNNSLGIEVTNGRRTLRPDGWAGAGCWLHCIKHGSRGEPVNIGGFIPASAGRTPAHHST